MALLKCLVFLLTSEELLLLVTFFCVELMSESIADWIEEFWRGLSFRSGTQTEFGTGGICIVEEDEEASALAA